MIASVENFRTAMRAAGLAYAGPILADGILHRFKAEGDRASNSWYLIHAGPPAAGAYGCWRRSLNDRWCESESQLSQHEWDRVAGRCAARNLNYGGLWRLQRKFPELALNIFMKNTKLKNDTNEIKPPRNSGLFIENPTATESAKSPPQPVPRRRNKAGRGMKARLSNVYKGANATGPVNFNPNVLVRKASALGQCEELIENASPTIIEVCLAIAQIRKQKLFWPAYETIEAYFRDCWHLQVQHIQRVLAVVEVVENLSPIGEIVVPGSKEEVEELLGFRSQPKPRKRQRNAPSSQSSEDHLQNAEAPWLPLGKFVEKIVEAVQAGQPEHQILRLLQQLKLRLMFSGLN